jgi:hypothetical protein
MRDAMISRRRRQDYIQTSYVQGIGTKPPVRETEEEGREIADDEWKRDIKSDMKIGQLGRGRGREENERRTMPNQYNISDGMVEQYIPWRDWT